MAVGEASDAAANDAIGEANRGRGGVLATAIAFLCSPRAGDGERGGAGDVDGDAPCAPLAPPLHMYLIVNSSVIDAEHSSTMV